MSLKKRERRVPVGARTLQEYPTLTFEQGLDLVISVKKSEGLRERTLSDYKKHYRYFLEWLNEVHPDVVYVHEITMQILRDHVSYMKYDRVRYEEHKFISSENQTFGVSDTN